MRRAEISGGIVVNLIEVDPNAVPSWAETWPETDTAGIGWTYADGDFSPPAEPEPEPELPPELTPQQWAFFLDLTGFRAVLDSTLDALPRTTPAEVQFWAGLRAIAYASAAYSQAVTLALVDQIRMTGAPGVPEDAQIIDAWPMAAAFGGAASMGVA